MNFDQKGGIMQTTVFTRKRHANLLVLVAGLLLLLNVVGPSGVSYSKPVEEITIGYSALRISLPIFVAQENEYFVNEGLKATLVPFDTAQPLMNSLVAGSIQMAGYTALPITYSAMLRSKTDLYFATAILEDQKHRISYLIVHRDVTRTFTIADLRGKKIGILPTVAYRVWLEEILKQRGVKSSEVEIVQIAPALTPSALESGQINALFTTDPAATTVLQRGIGRLLSAEVEVPKILGEKFIFGSFNMRKDYVDRNPETAVKVARALDKAVIFVNKNPGEAKRIMKKYLHESQRPFVEFYPDALYQTISETEPAKFQALADKYLEMGIIREKIDVHHLVLTEHFLQRGRDD